MSGKFIVFEGTEKVGKTFHINLLAQKLESENIKYKIFAEPNKNGLFGKYLYSAKTLTNLERLTLILAERSRQINIYKDYLKQNYHVICSRFFWSTIVYNSIDEISKNLIFDSIINFALIPDLTFYLYKKNLNINDFKNPENYLETLYHNLSIQSSLEDRFKQILKSTTLNFQKINTDYTKEDNSYLIYLKTKELIKNVK